MKITTSLVKVRMNFDPGEPFLFGLVDWTWKFGSSCLHTLKCEGSSHNVVQFFCNLTFSYIIFYKIFNLTGFLCSLSSCLRAKWPSSKVLLQELIVDMANSYSIFTNTLEFVDFWFFFPPQKIRGIFEHSAFWISF